jgi:hypothetical protein
MLDNHENDDDEAPADLAAPHFHHHYTTTPTLVMDNLTLKADTSTDDLTLKTIV